MKKEKSQTSRTELHDEADSIIFKYTCNLQEDFQLKKNTKEQEKEKKRKKKERKREKQNPNNTNPTRFEQQNTQTRNPAQQAFADSKILSICIHIHTHYLWICI